MSRQRPHEQTPQGFEYEDVPHVIRSFFNSIRRLQLQPEEIKGDVFVIGQGQAFPERGLICESEMGFTENYRPEVTSLATADPEFFTDPETNLWGKTVEVKDEEQPPGLKHDVVDYYPIGAHYLLEHWPQKPMFDTVMMFRIPDLEDQLRRGFLGALAPFVRPGGRFICSGSHRSAEKLVLDPHWKIVRTASLPLVDSTGYPFHDVNLGLVYQRLPDKKG